MISQGFIKRRYTSFVINVIGQDFINERPVSITCMHILSPDL